MDIKEVESGETNVLLDLTKWKGGVEMEGASVALQEENEARMLWRTRLKSASAKMARHRNRKEVLIPKFVRCHAICTFFFSANHD